jgi:hypothetical protein
VGLLVEQLGGDVLQRLVQQRAIGGIVAVAEESLPVWNA